MRDLAEQLGKRPDAVANALHLLLAEPESSGGPAEGVLETEYVRSLRQALFSAIRTLTMTHGAVTFSPLSGLLT